MTERIEGRNRRADDVARGKVCWRAVPDCCSSPPVGVRNFVQVAEVRMGCPRMLEGKVRKASRVLVAGRKEIRKGDGCAEVEAVHYLRMDAGMEEGRRAC